MSLLVLVRHGQASLLADDYDRLSPVGREQGRWLGRHWAAAGLAPDAVYVGPRARQRGTCDAAAAALRERGGELPPPRLLAELDEHHGHAVMDAVLPRLAERDERVRALLRRHQAGEAPDRAEYLRVFQRVLRAWACGELEAPEVEEPWAVFRRRVGAGLTRIFREHGGGQTVLAFTSGGFIAAAVGQVLELSDAKIAELSWTIRNGSYTELLFSGERVSLRAFNALPPMEARHHTYV